MEFSEKDVKSIADALRKPGGLVLGATPRASMTSEPGLRIGTKALTRLEASMQSVRHHETVNHKPTASQLRYDPVIKIFKLEFDALKKREKKEVSTPQIIQKLDVARWTETFLDFELQTLQTMLHLLY